MYYCFFCPPQSLIFLACHASFIHEFSCPVFSVCHFAWVKVASVFVCGAVRPTASQFVHTVVPPGNVAALVACLPFFFKAFICSEKRLISCCCLATMSTEISRLAANSASGPPFAAVCVAAAELFQPQMGHFNSWTSTVPIIWAHFRVHVLGSKTLF